MKKIILYCLFFIFGISTTQGQLLWKITGKGLKNPSYLFGTHHLIPIQFLDSVPGLYPAFNSAKMVVSEVVLNNLDATPAIRKAALLPDTITIRGLLNQAEYEFVNQELTNTLRMSLDNLNKMHPSLISKLYELELYKKYEHFEENTQSDTYFQLVAAKKGIPIAGLETVEQQVKLLFPENIKKETQLLVASIRNKEMLIQEMREMNRLYREGNLDALEVLANQSNKQWNVSEEENKKLIDDRNINWVKQLPDLIKNNSCFVAVGALHLPGNKGLIKLLKNEGYKVIPVK
jgi:uncharacterized protein YbaP (TraB family)